MNTITESKKIKLVLFDVDGVLTNGDVYINGEGEYFKSFNVKDGIAIELFSVYHILTGVISGKSSPALDYRCEQLKFDHVVTGCKNKLPKIMDICDSLNLRLSEVAYCGDDIIDVPIMQQCGLSFAPKDAHPYIKKVADIVLEEKGGEGVVRKIADLILLNRANSFEELYKPLLEKIALNDVDSIQQ